LLSPSAWVSLSASETLIRPDTSRQMIIFTDCLSYADGETHSYSFSVEKAREGARSRTVDDKYWQIGEKAEEMTLT
jgi:hypothetical protein